MTTNQDAELRLLAEQAVTLQRRIEGLGLPRSDKARKLLEYELTKVRLRIRDMKRVRTIAQRPRPLIPYAGFERD